MVVNCSGIFVLCGFFSRKPTSDYFGVQGTLTLGSETIDYGSHKESSFDKKTFPQSELYKIASFGSKILLSGIGFSFGVVFGW